MQAIDLYFGPPPPTLGAGGFQPVGKFDVDKFAKYFASGIGLGGQRESIG